MFKVADKNGQQIFLRDKVKYEGKPDDMGLLSQQEGMVIASPSETKVEVQNLEGGPPEIVDSNSVVVTYSLVAKVANLSSLEDLQLMVSEAEIRYDKAVKDSKPARKKRGAGKGTAAAKAKAETESLFD
jgi:hypothetical protein